MLKHKYFALLAACLLILSCEKPNLLLATKDGQQHDLAKLGDRHALLLYWASWCGPCRHELPIVNELAKAHAPEQVWVFSVRNFEHISAEDGKKALEANFPELTRDPSAQLGFKSPRGVPTAIIIDSRGNEVQRFEGAVGAAKLKRALNIG